MADAGKVYNDDVLSFYNRLNRFIEELYKSASANVSEVTVHDQTRLKTYLAALTNHLDWVQSIPLLDLPETHPMELALEPAPVIERIESLMVSDLIRLLTRLRDEVTNSQSARMASRFNQHDEGRIRSILEKATKYLDEYIAAVNPLDLPESSPSAEITGKGKKGV